MALSYEESADSQVVAFAKPNTPDKAMPATNFLEIFFINAPSKINLEIFMGIFSVKSVFRKYKNLNRRRYDLSYRTVFANVVPSHTHVPAYAL